MGHAKAPSARSLTSSCRSFCGPVAERGAAQDDHDRWAGDEGSFPSRIRLEPTNRVAWLRREVTRIAASR